MAEPDLPRPPAVGSQREEGRGPGEVPNGVAAPPAGPGGGGGNGAADGDDAAGGDGTGGDGTGGGPGTPDLRRQVGGALTWALLGQVAKRGATFLMGLVLARILSPEHFGVYTIALTVTMFVLAFNDVGIGYAVARHRGDDVEDLAATAATMALGFSLSVYALVFLLAPTIVGLFDETGAARADGAVGIIRLLAVTIVVDGAIAASAGAITRELDERARTLGELWGFGTSVLVNVVLAIAGTGAWALAAGQVTGSLTTAVLLLAWSPVRARFAWDGPRARALVRFGLPMMVAGTFNQLVLNSDYVIVNRYLGTAVTGAYFLAFNVSNWPVTLISYAMRRAAIAGFSRLAHDVDALQAAFIGSVRVLVTAVLPMALLIGLFANDVLHVLYGPRYVIGATALRFLAGISMVRLVTSLGIDLLTAVGRTTAILWVQVAWFTFLVPSMAWGADTHELVGVGVAQALVAGGIALPLLMWRLSTVGIRPSALVRPLGRPLLGGGALTVGALAARAPFGVPLVRLLAGGAAGLAAYALVVLPGTPAAERLRTRWRPPRSGTPSPSVNGD